jgi:ADP-ribosylation factor GTPase-activating protein 2/3
VDFAETGRKVHEEAKRIRQLRYDQQKEEARIERQRMRSGLLRRRPFEIGLNKGNAMTTNGAAKDGATQKNVAFPGWDSVPFLVRLPFPLLLRHPDLGRSLHLKYRACSDLSPTISSTPIIDDSPSVAWEKFRNQKAISSDVYFGWNI